MEFGWINLFGAGIVVLIMISNIIYAAREKQAETQTKVPNYLFACEQAGRYSCIGPGVKFCVSNIRQKSRMALESRAEFGRNPLFSESRGGQPGMRAGTA